jgi:hypothetical protein
MAIMWWIMQNANRGKGPIWAWIRSTLKMLAAFAMANAVALGLGDGNEFDNVGCSTAEKPNPAMRKAHVVECDEFDSGLDDEPDPGEEFAEYYWDYGYWDERAAESDVEFDRRPACISGGEFCLYRLPDGFCPVLQGRCKRLPGPPGDSAPTLGEVMRMVRQLDGKVDLVVIGTQQLKKENEVLRAENAALAQMQAEGLLTFVQKIDADSFKLVVAVLVHGDVAKAARALDVGVDRVRWQMRQWKARGGVHEALLDLIKWRKGKRLPGLCEFKEALAKVSAGADRESVLSEVLSGLMSMTDGNWQDVCADLKVELRKLMS